MNGLKLASNGSINSDKPMDFAVDSDHPLWMCDLKKKPKHYGLLKVTINSIAAFATRTLLVVNHGYTKTPSFITEWYYPAGTHSGSDKQTYGIGSFEVTVGAQIVTFKAKMNRSQFIITVDNGTNPAPVSNLYAEIKYYIYAQPLSEPIQES